MMIKSACKTLSTRLSAMGLSCLLAAGTAMIPAQAAALSTPQNTPSVVAEQTQQPAVSSAKWKKVGKHLRLRSSSGKYKKGMVKYGVTYRFAADGCLEGTVPAGSPSKTNTAADTLMTSFRPIYQYPELPTGCETTSLAMVLNYKGVPADKVNLANHYLDKGPVGKVSPWKAFVGDPRNPSAHGCYAPVVVNMANRYLTQKKSKLRAAYISGRDLETLAAYTGAGNPVIVWGTINCRAPYHSKTWVIDGQKIEWISPEHCVVLLGFRGTQVVIADPWTGRIVSYEKEVFRRGYNALHKQAVVIR